MRKVLLAASLFAALAAAGCSSGPAPVRGEGPEATGRTAAHQVGRWSPYLQVMSERERIDFLNIIDDKDRTRYLRVNGIDVRAELAAKLSRGLTLEAARRRMDDPLDVEDRRGDTVMLYYSRFNGDTRTSYYLKFESNQLVNWNTYTIAQQERTTELISFEAEITRRLDICLQRGLGPATIKQMALISAKRLDEVEQLYREKTGKTSEGDYNDRTDYSRKVRIEYDPATGKYVAVRDENGREVRVSRMNSNNYLVAEEILMMQAKADILGWFNREPDRIILHRPYETRQFHLPYKTKRGNIETVIVEFSFKDGLLDQWFVYHDE